MVQGIMLDGVWNSEPKDIKSAFIDFYKDKFSCYDSPVSFPPMLSAHCLSIADQDFLESMVSMDVIKAADWDCGSQEAPGLDGYSFMFIKKLWDLLKHDIQSFVVHFFSTGTFPQGSNSAFIMLIPKVSNPLFIKDYRPISVIGIHYKIVAKILANRLSKVIDSIISPEQSGFINGRQILDGPLILKGLYMALNDGLAANMFHDVKVGSLGVRLMSSEDSKKLAWVKWSNILASLDKGGLGVGSLKAFNMSLLLKWRWRLFYNPNALWVHVVKAIHGDETCIDIRGCHTNGVWASIDWSRPVNVGRTKAEFDGLISDIASLEPEELVDSDTCIWSLSHDDKFSVNSVRKHIDELSLPSLSPSTRWCKIIPRKVLCSLPFPHVASGIFGFSHGMPQRKIRVALTPSLLLLVGPYGGLEIISFSTLTL
ncbi:RNA-directed DNA polymerase, eukaryota, reverse transcriptase zinc-binding domain protein [Tanacetum coccineum]